MPAVVFVYYVLLKWSRPLQNVFLLLASLFFYAWGEPKFVLVMMLSIVINWAAGLFVSSFRASDRDRAARVALALAVVFNLIIIFIFNRTTPVRVSV